MPRTFSTSIMSPQAALQWWNAFNPLQTLSLASTGSHAVDRFDAGVRPDLALAHIAGGTPGRIRTPCGTVLIPADFIPPRSAAIDRPPPAAQAQLESGVVYSGDRRRGNTAGIAYECSALRSGNIIHNYDGDLAVASYNYEKIRARYRDQVDQIVRIYVRKCRGRFGKSFKSAALEGVLYAIKTYEASKGRFASWLIQCVHFTINKMAPEILGVTPGMMDAYYVMKKARTRFRHTYNRDPEDDELRFALGMTQTKFDLMRAHERRVYHAYQGLPFDERYMGVDTKREAYATIGNGEASYDRAQEAFERTRNLTARQRYAIQRFYFDADRPSLTAIGNEEGITCAAIGERMKGAMEKLERRVPGIRREFERIRPRAKRGAEERAKTAARKQRRQKLARAKSVRRFVARMLEPNHSSTSNFFNNAPYREILWGLTLQEQRILQHSIEGLGGDDIARKEGAGMTADDVRALLRTALDTLAEHKALLDDPAATAADISRARKRIEEAIELSEYITGGERITYLTDRPAEFRLLLGLLTDKQQEALELHLTGLHLIEIGERMGKVFPQVIYEHVATAREKMKGYRATVRTLRSHGMEVTADAVMHHEARATLSHYITDGDDPAYLYERPEEFALLVSLLTDRQREAIESHLAGLTEVQIADRMGVFPQVVHGHIDRARSELRTFQRIVRKLETTSISVTREAVLAHPFNVELSNFLTDGRDPYYVHSDDFEELCRVLSHDQMAVLRYRQFKNPDLPSIVPTRNIKQRYQTIKRRLKQALAERQAI